MPSAGDTFGLHDGETVTVVTATPELLELEAEWTASENKPPPHFHPSQDEHFEVTEGALTAEVDGETRTLRPGDTLDVPRGAVHSMWCGDEVPTRARWEVRPALRTADFFAAIDASRRYRKSARGGIMTPLGAGRVLHEYSDVFRLKVPGPVFGFLAVLGRLRGYPRPG